MRFGQVGIPKTKIIKRPCSCLIIIALFGIFAVPVIGFSENASNNEFSYHNSDGSIVSISFDTDMIIAATELAQKMQTSGLVRLATVLVPPGTAPQLILIGEPANLQNAYALVKHLFLNKTDKHLVVINATLTEITLTNSSDIGLNLVPSIGGNISLTWDNTSNTSQGNVQVNVQGNLPDIILLNKSLNKGDVLMSSEVYTPNGVKAEISNIKNVPIFSTDKLGNVQTQFQNLETSVSVTPIISSYNSDKPDESLIRVDVIVKVSTISGNHMNKGVSAPEYSVKTMTTTRLLRANNQRNVVGIFSSDEKLNSTSGIPILGELPLLKYLFSEKSSQKQKNAAVLTLSVYLLPNQP
jgi:type II secretory pathway component GspD/PulD (secretin)